MEFRVTKPYDDEPVVIKSSNNISSNSLKNMICKEENIPAKHQRLVFETPNSDIISTEPNDSNDPNKVNVTMYYDELKAGSSDCCCITCAIRPFECIYRFCCFFSGCDIQFNMCQWWCVRCIFCATESQKEESDL